jgi:Anti-sigma factor NepR
MASNHNQGSGGSHGGAGSSAAQRRAPEWADGLKQLYDSVVEEDLPDSFKDLLDQLDGLGGGAPSPGSNDNGSPAPDDRGKRP